MVAYHTGPVLFDAIAAALAQDEVAELILVDNGNDRATRERLATLARETPRLRVLTSERNVGFAAACNRAARAASGDYILLLNPDCILPPRLLADLIEVHRAHPDAWVLTPRLVDGDGAAQRGTPRNTLTPWTALVEALRLDRLAPNHPYFRRLNLHEQMVSALPVEVPAISGAFMLMRRAVYERMGGLDERYFLHVEDLDFCLRVLKAGGGILYVPGLAAVHLGGTSFTSFVLLEWHKAKSAHKYFNIHFSAFYPRSFMLLTSAVLFMRFAGLVALRALRSGRQGALRANANGDHLRARAIASHEARRPR